MSIVSAPENGCARYYDVCAGFSYQSNIIESYATVNFDGDTDLQF